MLRFVSKKDFIQYIGYQYNLRKKTIDIPIFYVFWELYQIGDRYRKEKKTAIEEGLDENYKALIASIMGTSQFREYTGRDTIQEHTIDHNVFTRVKTITYRSKESMPLGGNISNINPPNIDPIRRLNFPHTRPQPNLNKGPINFVIFSDHHMTEKGHRHNYFEKNKELYMELLDYYADEGFGLIENGDVEEYTIFEPTIKIANGYNNLINKQPDTLFEHLAGENVGSINWEHLRVQRIKNRKEILPRIIEDNIELYELIDDKFAKKGSDYYTKVTGNHDPYLAQDLILTLPKNFRDNLCDVLKIHHKPIGGRQEYLKYFVTHGHQFDSSTLPQHAFALGEVFSETLGWTIQGADRIWNASKTEPWRNPNKQVAFRNILATAKPMSNPDSLFSGFGIGIDIAAEIVIEILMQGHEIAWEYFDNSSRIQAFQQEVMTGDEYFKVRHLSETVLVAELEKYYGHTDIRDWAHKPKLIIGHTHEPRSHPKRLTTKNGTTPYYLNSGSAGRFENPPELPNAR